MCSRSRWSFFPLSCSPGQLPTPTRTNEPNFDIVTLSNRADLIGGGDALVEIRVPHNVPLHQVTVLLNEDVDVTAMFRTDAAARTMRGVVTGLAVGPNTLIADSNGIGNGRPRASLTITNHPIGGPVLLGSQTQPWVCATPTPEIDPATGATTNVSGLSTHAVDAQCNIATEYKLFYRTTNSPCSSSLPDPEPAGPPAGKRLLQAVYGRRHAPRSGDDHDDERRDGAVHRARRARHDQSRHLRHRDPLRPDQRDALDGTLAAAAVEPQGGLHVRRFDRPAAAAIPHRAELGR